MLSRTGHILPTLSKSNEDKILAGLEQIGKTASEIRRKRNKTNSQGLISNFPTTNSLTSQSNHASLINNRQTNNFSTLFHNNQSNSIRASFTHNPSQIQASFELSREDLTALITDMGSVLLNLVNWLKQQTIDWAGSHPLKAMSAALASFVGAYLGFYYLGGSYIASNIVAPILSAFGISAEIGASIGGSIIGASSIFILLRAVIKMGELFIDTINNSNQLNDALNDHQLDTTTSSIEVIDITEHLLGIKSPSERLALKNS